MLDNRLKMCADMVSGKGIVCDVGTDHAYLAAELITSGKCSRVIASDVRQGPLNAAAKTVEKYDISDKVELVLSNGLENISPKNVSDVVIAGMGGETIIEILDNAPVSWQCNDECRFILQPMTKVEELRKWLWETGKTIVEERAVEDGDRVYIVMSVSTEITLTTVSELKCYRGIVDVNDSAGRKFLEIQAHSLMKRSEALAAADRKELALHYKNLAENLLDDDREPVALSDIYDFLDAKYPFSTREKWDNSGLLIDSNASVSTILLTLDIDNDAVDEARFCGAELIVSHHPVIFDPLRKIESGSPVYKMIRNDISGICMHTNLDIADGGTNGIILRKLAERFCFDGSPEPFCDGFGWVCTLAEPITAVDFADAVKEIFGCEYVRVNRNYTDFILKFAFCSGSGGSMLREAVSRGCDAYITGDVKHDVWVDANNSDIALFDCGHFHTENIVLSELRYVLEQHFPQIEVVIAESSVDPVVYF